MAESTNASEEPSPTAMQDEDESTLEAVNGAQQSDGIEHIEGKDASESSDAKTGDELGQELHEGVASDSSSFQTEHDQQAYANLEPILVAMELGQEILQSNGEHHHTEDEEANEGTIIQMEVQHDDDAAIVQPDVATDTSSNVVAITQEQLASLFANSGTAGGGNVIVTSLPSDGSAGQGGLSLATILQDVVSGIQHTNGAQTVLTDSSGNTGSYYLVTQGGTIPIVMPTTVGSTGVTSMNLVQASSGDTTTFVTVNPDSDGVDVPATVQTSESEDAARNSHLTTVQTVDSTAAIAESETISETVSSDQELATAAAAVENDGELQEAITTPVAVVASSVKRRLSNGPRVCAQCNKAFKYPSDLKKHLQIHTDIKKFKCDECNRFFRRLHQLVVHQRIHTGEKPYICKHCGTAFRHDSTLTMHVRTRHEHKRPFKCTFCEHTFGRLSHLRKHVKKVCGPNKQEKQASAACTTCKFCELVFPNKIELRKHATMCDKKEVSKAKQPSQVALHVCNICNKDFASPYNVRRHQLTHSDDRPFECEYCSKCFKEKSSLTKHVKRVHLGKGGEKELEDDSLDETATELHVVSISNHQDQHLEVVSMNNEEESLLALQPGSSSDSNAETTTTTVDSSTLVQVAASVMVEELMHGDDDHNPDASCTTTTVSSSHPTMFMSDAQMMADTTVSCMGDTSTEVAPSDSTSLAVVCLENQDPDSSHMGHEPVMSSTHFEGEEHEDVDDSMKPNEDNDHEVEECSSEPIQGMVLGSDS